MKYGKTYATFADAVERVNRIKAATGRWPGIRTNPDGTFTPTFNPRTLSEWLTDAPT